MTRAQASLMAAIALFAGCDVYDTTLLVTDAGTDVAPDVCATLCSTLCVNLQTDQNNCGTCNHACETGCSAGVCTPTVLAPALGAPHGILVAGSSLYVALNGAINVEVMSKIDGTGLKNFASALIQPDRLATDGNELYWTDDANILTGAMMTSQNAGGSVWEGGFDGGTTDCSGAYCFYVRDLPAPYGIAVQGSNMFFTTTGTPNMSGGGCLATSWVGSVLACPTTGCDVSNCATSGGPNVIAQNQTQLASVAADSKNVYWADFGGKEVRFCPQPSCTGGVKPFASGLAGPWDVISNGTTVYFSDRAGGALYSCPTTGCGVNPTMLASGLDDPFLLATDGTTLYATLYKAGQIIACTLPSCAGGPTVVASGLHAPYGITTDSTYVYWSEEGSNGTASTDGNVSKLRKN
jgi:hypothetical protein